MFLQYYVTESTTGNQVNIEINDFGATPGVVRLRLEQALEEVQHD